ncbi:MAG TPA: MFS transporter [Bdellovibrionales bacterium]|nr:MFS transporter [Bdellovibrionales bacterium]
MKPNALLITLALPVLLASAGTSMANIALPAIAESLDAPATNVRWVVTSYLAASTLLALLSGRLGDVLGPKRVLLAGLALFAVSAGLAGASSNLHTLLFARALQGAAASALFVLPLTFVAGTRAQSGARVGWLTSMSAVGTASGPLAGGYLVAGLGWRSSFYFMAIAAAFALILSYRVLPAAERSSAQSQPARAKSRNARATGIGLHLALTALVSAILVGALVIGPFFLAHGLKLGARQIGLLMAIGPVVSIVSGVISGRIVDRYGSSRVISAGLAFILLGSLAFATLPLALMATGYALSAMVLSFGYQLFQASNTTLVLSREAPHAKGQSSGALALSRNLGLIAGTAVFGLVYDTLGFQMTFLFAALLVAASLAIVHSTRNKELDHETKFA